MSNADRPVPGAASPVFCLAPWTHLHVLTTGEIFPCCMSAHDSSNAIGRMRDGDTLADAWNSSRMRGIRRDMLAGVPSRLCERCYQMEKVGQESWRTTQLRDLAHHGGTIDLTREDGGLDNFAPPYLDVRFSNICNLKCRICTPKLSSAWHRDGVAVGLTTSDSPVIITPTEDPAALWAQLAPLLDSVERLHFAGGEPLLQEEHYRILAWLIDHQRFDVTLSYNTNLSRFHYRSFDVLSMWRQFPNVIVQASLDGMGARGDYMRKGQRWDEIVRNRERMRAECPHVEFSVLATVSMMNVLHLPEFYLDWTSRGFIGINDLQLNLLFEPHYFNIRGLPGAFKARVRDSYQRFIAAHLEPLGDRAGTTRRHFESVVSYMSAEDWDVVDEFRDHMKSLDVLRRENFAATFPELAELIAPSPVIDRLHLARATRRAGKLADARREFDLAVDGARDELARNADSGGTALAVMFLERGCLNAQLEDGARAIEDFTRAIELDAAMTMAYVERGFQRLCSGDRTQAEADFAIAAAPYVNAVASGCGIDFQGLRRHAGVASTNGIATDPSAAIAAAHDSRARGDLQAAAEQHVTVVAAMPAQAADHLHRCLLRSRGGPLQLLPGGSSAALDLFTTPAFALYLIGVAHERLRDLARARRAFEQARALAPSWRFVDHHLRSLGTATDPAT